MINEKIMNVLGLVCEEIEPVGNQKVAAALVYRKNIMSIGHNKRKTHSFQKRYSKNDKSIVFHAETNCIYNALKKMSVSDIKKCSLYVFRPLKNGDWALAKPCEGCTKAIIQYGIKKVYYTAGKDLIECF